VTFSFTVDERVTDGDRVDRVLAEHYLEIPRSQIRHRVTDLRCNELAAKLSTKVHAGDVIEGTLLPEAPLGAEPEDVPLTVIYEDDDVLVINKEQGRVVHPGAGNRTGTIANALAFRFSGHDAFDEGDTRPGIVHRLDKETSGVMIIAKNAETHAHLVDQFATRAVDKRYIAIVKGCPRPRTGTIDLPIGRDRYHRTRFRAMRSDAHGVKEALTSYEVLREFPRHSLVRFQPHTGRTHQIRVHAVAIASPILGDPVYARSDRDLPDATLMLHAYLLRIVVRPGEPPKQFRAGVPERFRDAISRLSRR
jgi:23S rRNA pseudouridine1911/1915/1917 synthase